MGFEKVIDENIRRLAQMLRSNGLAMSDTEALRMAQEMSSTASKVQESYDKQNEENKKKPVSASGQQAAKRPVRESDDDYGLTPTGKVNAEQAAKIYSQQKNVYDAGYDGKTVKELLEEDAEEVYAHEEPHAPKQSDNSASEPEVVEPAVEPEVSKPAVSKQPLSDEDVTIFDLDENDVSAKPKQPEPKAEDEPEMFSEGDFEVEQTKEIKTQKKSEEERKKEAKSMAESNVDLGNMFNYGKK